MAFIFGFIIGFIASVLIVKCTAKSLINKNHLTSAVYIESQKKWVVRGNLFTIANIIEDVEKGRRTGTVERKK